MDPTSFSLPLGAHVGSHLMQLPEELLVEIAKCLLVGTTGTIDPIACRACKSGSCRRHVVRHLHPEILATCQKVLAVCAPVLYDRHVKVLVELRNSQLNISRTVESVMDLVAVYLHRVHAIGKCNHACNTLEFDRYPVAWCTIARFRKITIRVRLLSRTFQTIPYFLRLTDTLFADKQVSVSLDGLEGIWYFERPSSASSQRKFLYHFSSSSCGKACFSNHYDYDSLGAEHVYSFGRKIAEVNMFSERCKHHGNSLTIIDPASCAMLTDSRVWFGVLLNCEKGITATEQ